MKRSSLEAAGRANSKLITELAHLETKSICATFLILDNFHVRARLTKEKGFVMARKSKNGGKESGRPQGFEEAAQSGFLLEESKPGFGVANRLRLTLGPGGRVVIPAPLREAMEVNEGDALLVWIEDGELHLLNPRVGARQAQSMLKGLFPEGVSLVDELIADRRLEAEAEARG